MNTINKIIKIIFYPIQEITEILIRISEIYPNTKLGYLFRNIILKKILFIFGNNNRISNNVNIRGRENIVISSKVHIATGCFIGADTTNGIFIGNNVYIGPNCVLRSSNHKYLKEISFPIQNYKKINLKKKNLDLSFGIIIEDNVWIGASCIILAGSHIKSGTIIGANSLVNKSLQRNSLYLGSPAIKIKNV
jgi:acetyltransferase-like isoleucine patch superfamily enzyme